MLYQTTCKAAIHPLKRPHPYELDLNVYRGCTHGCSYCYAQGSHQYMEQKNFFKDIYVKRNIVDVLEKELRRRGNRVRYETINLGGVTDNYQAAEKEMGLMPDILRLLIRYQVPIIISTKSILPLRDFDLIEELASITHVNIAASIVTMDDKLKQILEPGAAFPKQRFELLQEFSHTKATTGLHMMPILPFLTDQDENLETLLAYGSQVKVDYVLPGTLYLRGATRPHFFKWLGHYFPELVESYQSLYQKGRLHKAYQVKLYEKLNPLIQKHHLSTNYKKVLLKKAELKIAPDVEQLTLF